MEAVTVLRSGEERIAGDAFGRGVENVNSSPFFTARESFQ